VDEDCLRLTSYFRERQRTDGRPLADALTGLYASRQVAASIVLHGTEGMSAAVAVSPRPDIEALLGQVVELAGPGMVTIEQARLLTGDIEPAWLGEEPGEATMLAVHLGRQDSVYQVPAFEALCELLYRRGIAGATVLPGTDGTLRGRRQHPQHPQFLRHDADTPLMVVAVGSGNEIGMILPELGLLFRHPVITVEKVKVCQRDGQSVNRPQVFPAGAPEGTAPLLKLTVYTSEAARHEGQPVHRAVARHLGLAGAGSVTAVHGIWGFHADHAPHGDHFPHRGRHVPVVTTATGTPEQISAAFDAVGTLTAERGLVTVQTVLAVQAAGSAQQPC
jgi:PII-like signaling protein